MTTRPLLRDRVAEELRTMVVEAQGPKAVRIDSERVLAERFGVSRLVLRTAIQALVEEGYLTQKRGSGTYVVPKAKIDHVGIVCAPDIRMKDPIFFQLLEEITYFLAEEQIVLSNIHAETALTGNQSQMPIVIMGQLDGKTVRRLTSECRYAVSMQCYPGVTELTQVYFDDRSIGHHAGEQLLSHGHRRVLHLAGPQRFPSASERQQGFLHSLADYDMEVTVREGKMNWKGGYDLATSLGPLLSTGNRPTGVFAANDLMALGFMQHLAELGMRVPDDISVIGCDDIHLSSEIVPHLSTFRLNTLELVREVFTLLNNMIFSGGPTPTKQILIPADYVVRDSVRSIAGPA